MKKVIIKQIGKRISFMGYNLSTPCKFFIPDDKERIFRSYMKQIGIKDFEVKSDKPKKKPVVKKAEPKKEMPQVKKSEEKKVEKISKIENKKK